MNIIDKVVETPRSRKLVRIAIPVLIQWAKLGKTDSTYKHLIHAFGYKKFSGIGKILGRVDDVLKFLSRQSGEKIPTLNALCKNQKTQLPSHGFSYVKKRFEKLSFSEKQIYVNGLNLKAIQYQKWDWVLEQLKLKPIILLETNAFNNYLESNYSGFGGEGIEHKKIKDFISNNPNSIISKAVEETETEHILPSGDKLDVYFKLKNGNHIAVEVKPSTAPIFDITRGIFQCVKYQSVMDAMRNVTSGNYENKTILVLGKSMPTQCKQLAELLNIDYIEDFIVD